VLAQHEAHSALARENNRARKLIEKRALVGSSKSGRTGMAAVDVFESETHFAAVTIAWLANAGVATPHLGYVEPDSYGYFSCPPSTTCEFVHGQTRTSSTRLR